MSRLFQSWRQIIASMLIFLLLVSQTIRVDFLSEANASEDQYRDIVSIFVDRETYGTLRSKINRYAEDIQTYLGSTRASVFVVGNDVTPAQIASQNERLYYQGDGEKGIVSHLVGTVLIGDIPIPMVQSDTSSFPSLYPYVDFVDKKFVYDNTKKSYITPLGSQQRVIEPEIWHGVMNPALGRVFRRSGTDSDTAQLSNFLDKTHEFYTAKGVFAPSSVPPRVFYYDGYAESKSVEKRSAYQYVLNLQNSENIAYRRYNRYLLQDINELLKQFDQKNQGEEQDILASLGLTGSTDTLSQEDFTSVPDIQTEVPIKNLLKDFHAIINTKTLGDELLAVHNAGRYNTGANVRADLAATVMTAMDDTARSMLLTANESIMNSIDLYLSGAGVIRSIPILNTYEKKQPIQNGATVTSGGNPGYGYNTFQYQNYLFGQKVSDIQRADQCTIARGGNTGSGLFLHPVLVEANPMYDVRTGEPTGDLLKNDTELLLKIHRSANYACFDTSSGTPKATSYWGGNSLLALSVKRGGQGDIFGGWPSGTVFTGMTQSINDLGGMKETNRLPPASLQNCIDKTYQSTLEVPGTFSYLAEEPMGDSSTTVLCTESNLEEWNTFGFGACRSTISSLAPKPLRYSCISRPDTLNYAGTLGTDIARWSASSSRFFSSCLVGTVSLDGAVVARAQSPCIETVGSADDQRTVDNTNYESVSYRTVPGILRHVSPTDEEISAAKVSGVTPNIPVDIERYVEFVTPKGNIARINYPNFFQTPATDIASFRAWLKTLSEQDWNTIIAKESTTTLSPEEDTIAKQYLGVKNALTASPVDWNQYLSDQAITKILQAKNWLNPDIAKKYTNAITAALSYSRGASSDLSGVPVVPGLSQSYEVAYLGLKGFAPESMNMTQDADMEQYQITLQEINALNISEQDILESQSLLPAPSDQCGPPEGVSIFEWPKAIMCWIKSLTPMRIVGQACGANTTGTKNNLPPTVTPPADTKNSFAALSTFYTGGKLTYHLTQSSLLPDEQASLDVRYEKDGKVLAFPASATATVEFVSGTDSTKKAILPGELSSVLDISPNPTSVTDAGAKFLLSPQGRLATVNLRAIIKVTSSDGKELVISSDTFSIRISDEYLDVTPMIDGQVTTLLPVTSSTGMMLSFSVKNMSGEILTPEYPITLDIYDDVSGTALSMGTVIERDNYILPSTYTKTPGVIRLELRDHLGRRATQSIGLSAGPLAKASFSPVSSAIIERSDTPVFLRLRDALGNPISPDLHSVDLMIQGGYFLTEGGEKKETLHFDSIESEIPLTVGSDRVGNISLRATVDNYIKADTTIAVIEKATVVLTRDADPEVGGKPVSVTVKVLGPDGNPIPGFRSVAVLTMGDGAGGFTPSITAIESGVSTPVQYIPGQVSGVQGVSVSIPGIQTTGMIDFSVNAGTPMYVTHQIEGDNIVFSLRDRYGNVVPLSTPAILTRGDRSKTDIAFTLGKYSIPKSTGYYRVDVPALTPNTLSYSDESGVHTIKAIDHYSVWIADTPPGFDFAPDYNARYTVLAGDAFLTEAADILYHTTVGSAQSLAVTTLLDRPFTKNSLFTILPGGGIRLGSASDTLPEASLTLEGGYPKISLRDQVSQSVLARIRYKVSKPTLQACEGTCQDIRNDDSRISLISGSSGVVAKSTGGKLELSSNDTILLSVSREGSLSVAPGVELHPNIDASQHALSLDVTTLEGKVGSLIYQVAPSESILLANIFTPDRVTLESFASTPIISTYGDRFGSTALGYEGVKSDNNTTLDTEKNGPERIDSLGSLSEVNAVGWGGSNRMMLSYAGGDTVGEATKWFHTYTMVNLGDPVTHNDKKAPDTELEGMDRSIGTELTSPQASAVSAFFTKDMNKDGLPDVVVEHSDGYIELILNLRDRMRSRGNIAYIPNMIGRGFSLGDFSGDAYPDIFGVNSDGNFVLLSNDERRFVTRSIEIQGGLPVPTKVTQFKIYDMDADKRDDIVYLTEGGELGVLYGTATPGVFDKKILDSTLGITLDTASSVHGGAFYDAGLPQYPLTSPTTSTTLDTTRLYNEVYVPFTFPAPSTADSIIDLSTPSGNESFQTFFDTNLTSVAGSTVAADKTKNFVKSKYAEAENIVIKRTVTPLVSGMLESGDTVRTTITIENKTNRTLRDATYIDTIPAIFLTDKTKTYTLTLDGTTTTRDFSTLPQGDFDAYFSLLDIPAGKTLTLSYDAILSPMSYGELLVGDYEKGETGADAYGDVGFQTSTTCGADMILWRSTAVRSYERGVRSFAQAELPEGIRSQLLDADKNGTPDSMENMTTDDQKKIMNQVLSSSVGSSRSKDLLNVTVDPSRQMLDIGFDSQSMANLESKMQEIANGLNCGFGGGGCMNFPMNWAPLAPGSAPVAFGYPLSKLSTDTGKPLFSAMTCGMFTICYPGGCTTIGFPMVYPGTPIGADSYGSAAGTQNPQSCSNTAGQAGAGGAMGDGFRMNSVRIYATPTLTLAGGVAMCFGGPASKSGKNPGSGTWPRQQGGNCIVMTGNLNSCKGDGSATDGNVQGISGLGSIRDTWNAASCSIKAGSSTLSPSPLEQDIKNYIKTPDSTKLGDIYQRMSNRTLSSSLAGPLLRIGGASTNGALSAIDVSIDTAKPLTMSNIVKVKNKRIAGYPDFIMDWMSRQIDQLTNSLLTPPNLVIIPPTSVGQNAQFDGSLSGLTDTFTKAYSAKNIEHISTKAGQAYDATVNSESATKSLVGMTQSSSNATSSLGKWIQGQEQAFENMQDSAFKGELGKIADQGKGGLAAMRTAYKLIGKLPLISISEKTVPINVPWILPQELDQYARAMDAYSREANNFMNSFCANDPSPECLAKKAKIQSSGLINSINMNLKRIEEYKNFPIKLQKYITWKQRYLSQILCYITEVQQMTTGWVKDNSIRFRKWAELIVLIKAVAKSWQPLLDIVAQKDAQCSVCHNERYNSKYWKYKIISALIPSIPVIQFPRWPDIVLDLHDVRLGIVLSVPNFQFNVNPIRLPALPSLSLPRAPNLSVTLPTIPVLPAIPELPDLPSLPAIPTIKLPNLPPPPKLPKLFVEVKAVLNILKLFKMMECYVNKTTLVPEWTAGDVIAQRTERQGTMPGLDFIDIQLPQISIPTIREIRVASHVNFEMRSDFITLFAQAAVKPINSFTSDLGRGTPTKIGPDIQINTPSTIKVNLQSQTTGSGFIDTLIASLESEKDVYLDQDAFTDLLRKAYREVPELSQDRDTLDKNLLAAKDEEQQETKKILAENQKKFNLLTDYVNAQYNETAKLQNIVDLLSQKTHSLAHVDARAEMVADQKQSRLSTGIAASINQLATAPVHEEIRPVGDFAQERDMLTSKLGRLAANDAFSSSNPTSSPIADGYSPNYQGIYILTPSGVQTRLFDYIGPLRGDDTATKVDIDQDGDQDYLFLLDGALFLKRSTLDAPAKKIDTHITVADMNTKDALPTAPNFFHEMASLPKALNFSYSASSSDETLWRTDFYDRYLEWDMIDIGSHDDANTPKHTVEVLRNNTIDNNDAPLVQRVTRSLARIENPENTLIEGPKLRVLTGGTEFTLGAGRTLYTSSRNASITYTTPDNPSPQTQVLLAFQSYRFPTERTINLTAGTLYIFSPTATAEIYTYTDDLIGMPIIPGIHIFARGGEVRLRDMKTDQDITIKTGGMYRMEGASSLNSDYAVEFAYPNGMYYPRIKNIDRIDTTQAGEILFAPQAANDTSAPEWSLTDALHVPVYQTKAYALKDLVTETSGYTVLVDADETQDANGNGIYDDDFGVTGSGVSIGSGNIVFGPFDTPGTKTMTFQITDDFHNTTLSKVDVIIYPPIPMIQSATLTGSIVGTLDESLFAEPIHFFRVRQGSDIRLMEIPPTLTATGGTFARSFTNTSGALLTTSGAKIDLVESGLWQSLPDGYTSQVVLASALSPLHVDIRDRGGSPVYQMIFALPETHIVLDGTTTSDALMVSSEAGMAPVSATVHDPNIPGGVYIVSGEKKPVFALARDGNIYSTTDNTRATFSQSGGYPVITLFVGEKKVATITYHFDFFFTTK